MFDRSGSHLYLFILILPSAPKLAPEALTTLGNLEVSDVLFVSFLNISPDMMLLVAPVSNNVLML